MGKTKINNFCRMSGISTIHLDALKQCVQDKFAEIHAALKMREKLLLRQIDVIYQQQIERDGRSISLERENSMQQRTQHTEIAINNQNNLKFLSEHEDDLLAAIRSFGRFKLGNINPALQGVYLRNEDYITPSNDHETMYKFLQQSFCAPEDLAKHEDEIQPETIVVDFSKNKSLIEHNAKNMNESIVNITLQEAKELISKSKPKHEILRYPLNLEELNDELESSITEAVLSLNHESSNKTKSSRSVVESKHKSKQGCFKPNITINNCNGTINLRNISSLTINCAKEDSLRAKTTLHYENQKDENEERGVGTQGSDTHIPKETACPASANAQYCTTTHPSVVVESFYTGSSTPTIASSSSYSSNSSSRSQSNKHKGGKNSKDTITTTDSSKTTNPSSTGTTQPRNFCSAYDYHVINDDDEPHDVTCNFYNRLLDEIKNSFKEKSRYSYNQSASTQKPLYNTESNTSSCPTEQQPNRRLVLKNFENLKIVLEANNDEDPPPPVQIEQWLAEIISETDLEPVQNTDILEHSKIHSGSV